MLTQEAAVERVELLELVAVMEEVLMEMVLQHMVAVAVVELTHSVIVAVEDIKEL